MLAGATGTANLGDGVFRVALPLVAVGITRSPATVAGVEAARSLAWPVLALPVGVAADRLDRRRVMIVANAARAALAFAAAALLGFGWESIALLYAIAIGVGIAEVFSDTAGQSVLPSVVERTELGRANGRLAALEQGAQQFVGPPVVGLLIAMGASAAFVGPAALWAGTVVLLWCLRGRFQPARVRGSSTVRAEIGQGLRFVAGRPVLRLMAGTVGVANLATSAAGSVLVLFAVGESSSLGLDESHFTLLILGAAVGGVLGSLLYEPLARRLGRALGLKVAIVGIALSVGAPAVSTDVWVVTGTMFVGGAAVMLWNVPTVAYRQALTPDHLLGRVNSVYRLVAFGTMPLGAVLAGLTAETIGLRSVFAGSALLTLALLVPVGRLGDAALSEPDRVPEDDVAGAVHAPSAPA
ncbi:MAG TPA: MFS transporter [Iamia sp.]|nr:MFS transporter [Iamia sp.]